MTKASKFALQRNAYALLSLTPPFLLPSLLNFADASHASQLAAAVVALAVVAVSAIAFFYFVFLWHPRCPRCRKTGARFIRRGDEELLVCRTCDFEEKTGYHYHG